MSTKVIFIFLIILMGILGVACKAPRESQNVTDITSNQEMVYPDDLMKFHIERQRGQAIFVLTVYKIPYRGHFQFIYLTESDVLWTANDFSETAIRGGWHGEITPAERENAINSLNTIQHNSTTAALQGEYVLTLSYNKPDGVFVYSYQNMSCPIAICSIYELANATNDRIQEITNDKELTCPITNASLK